MYAGLVITSANGDVGIGESIKVLKNGGTAMDAIVSGIRMVESNLSDHSVGRGGLPNLLGQVELDASVMDGQTLRAGAVAGLKNFEHPISIAQKVMEELPHVMLVDRGAAKFAKEMGFRPRNLLTAAAKRKWVEGLDERGEGLQGMDKYLDNLRKYSSKLPTPKHLGTVNFIARDRKGNIASGVSTSGLGWKYPGRVGDSPIIGAGNFADNRYGSAACTGRGELSMRACTARSVVMYLQSGMTLMDAGQKAMEDLKDYQDSFGTYMNIVCMDKDGQTAAFSFAESTTYNVQNEEMDRYEEVPRRKVNI